MYGVLPNTRVLNLLIAAGCAAAMGVALYMQYEMNLEPCPLCIMQRVMVILAGTIALIAGLHNPSVSGVKVYASLMIVASLLGAGLASRQVWLQSLPEDQVPACGPSLDYLLDVFPLTEVLQMVLTGDGTCAEVVWTMLGISIPGWTLIGFAGLTVLGVLQILRPAGTNQWR